MKTIHASTFGVLSLAACVALATSPATVHAVAQPAIYSTFGAGQTFDSSSGRIMGPIPVADANVALAATFTIPALFHLDSFKVALQGFDGENVDVTLWRPSTDGPGDPITRNTVSVEAPDATVIDFPVFAPPLLPAGTYWVSLSTDAPSSSEAQFHTWLDSPSMTGDVAFATDGGGSWTVSNNEIMPAFSVHGSMVPEPSGIMVLGGCAAGLLARRRRRGV